MYNLGLSKKTRDKYSSRTSIDAIDEKYNTCSEFLDRLFDSIESLPGMKDVFFHSSDIEKYNLDTNKDFKDFSLFYHNSIGNISLVFNPLENVHDKVKFRVTVSNFPGYNYATFNFIQIDGGIFLTNNHDLFINELEEADRYNLLYDMSASSITVMAKAIRFLMSNDSMNIKSIADALMQTGNICSGNISLYDIDNKNVIQYYHDFWHNKNKSENLSQSKYINEITIVKGKEEFQKNRYKIKSISQICLDDFKKRYEEYQKEKSQR